MDELKNRINEFLELAAENKLINIDMSVDDYPLTRDHSEGYSLWSNQNGVNDLTYDNFAKYLKEIGLVKEPYKDYSLNQVLDNILEIIINEEYFAYKNEIFSKVKMFVPDQERDELLDKLLSDEMIRFEKTSNGKVTYYPTFDGRFFWENEGYVKKHLKEQILMEETAARTRRMERNENLLAKWTVVLAIATIALVTWEVMRFYVFEETSAPASNSTHQEIPSE